MPIVLLDTSIDVRQGVSSCQLSYQTLLQMSDREFHHANCLTRHFYRCQTGGFIVPVVLLDTSIDFRQGVTSCQLSYQTLLQMSDRRLHHANCLTRQVTSCQLFYQIGYIMPIVLLDRLHHANCLTRQGTSCQLSYQTVNLPGHLCVEHQHQYKSVSSFCCRWLFLLSILTRFNQC